MLIPDAVKVPRKIAKFDTGGADAFNAESARQQQIAGVNPDLCLQLLMVSRQSRTDRTHFFRALLARRWITPSKGEWRDHDELFHDKAIRELHPHFVSVVMKAAEVGLVFDAHGEHREAAISADAIDEFVDVRTMARAYRNLTEAAFTESSESPDFALQVDHRRHLGMSRADELVMPSPTFLFIAPEFIESSEL